MEEENVGLPLVVASDLAQARHLRGTWERAVVVRKD